MDLRGGPLTREGVEHQIPRSQHAGTYQLREDLQGFGHQFLALGCPDTESCAHVAPPLPTGLN